MCGIAGILDLVQVNDEKDNENSLIKMLAAMKNRGPDAKGHIKLSGAMLGHVRLAIIDLDERSNQPFMSDCGRYAVTYNGEIYNFKELRSELTQLGEVFSTSGDTEVLLKLYIRYEEEMLTRLRGMFAFVIWDNLTKSSFIARDPYGIKPLYYSMTNSRFIFSSQIKSLLKSGLVSADVCKKGSSSYWLFGSVFGPETWFEKIFEFPAGAWAKFDSRREKLIPIHYWDIGGYWFNSYSQYRHDKIQNLVRNKVRESVKCHLVADVDVGIFLSAGIDSAVIAGICADMDRVNITCITIEYDEFQNTSDDEAPLACKLADYYGLQHYRRKVTKKEFLSDLPEILNQMDQPTVDGINTWYAAKAAKEIGLKVVLSGVGGDELFFGYRHLHYLPALVRVSRLVFKIPVLRALVRYFFNLRARISKKDRWNKLLESGQGFETAWVLRRCLNTAKELRAFEATNELEEKVFPEIISGNIGVVSTDNPKVGLAGLENIYYLQNQLLRDSDWATMAHGVELRCPLVDAYLLMALSPYLDQLSRHKGKTLLCNVPNRPIPNFIARKRKTGFSIPVRQWLGEELCLSNLTYQKFISDRVYSFLKSPS